MDNQPSGQSTPPAGGANQPPAPEVLQPRGVGAPTAATPQTGASSSQPLAKKRRTFKPSHKATFIGLAVVLAILAVNAVVFMFVLKKQANQKELFDKGQVSISSEDLNRLGINRSVVGKSGVQLIVAPDAEFKSKVTVAGNSVFSGEVLLNSKLRGTEANFSQLQGGKTALSDLNVNGDGTLSNLNLRKNLVVSGLTQFQGTVTANQLVTINNNLHVIGNLAVGGTLSVSNFSARSLTSTSTLSIGGHIITNGPAPHVASGSALGSNGTVSISGNDAAGALGINIGVGASGGILAGVTFANTYSGTPKVVISPVGVGGSFYVSSVNTAGFSVGVTGGLPPGGYRINYIVFQ